MEGHHAYKTTRAKYRILHVDAQPIFCQGFAKLLGEQSDLHMQICGHAVDASTALAALEKLKPEMLILDISLLGTNGIELIKMIKARSEQLPILVLTELDELDYGERAMRAGASGYVMKQMPVDEVIRAIREVLRGGTYLSKRLQSRIVQKFFGGYSARPGTEVEALTDREIEIFSLIGQGCKTKDIGATLHVSVKTVETHRAHIKEKLKLKDGMELVRRAVRWVDERERHQRALPPETGAAAFQDPRPDQQ